MRLHIRNERVHALPRRLAGRGSVPMAKAVVRPVDAELQGDVEAVSLAECVATLAGELASEAGRNRRSMSKDEIDTMWGC